jgi:ribose transport system permease protein
MQTKVADKGGTALGLSGTLRAWRDSGQLNALAPIGVLVLMIAVMTIGNTNFMTTGNFVNILVQIVTLLIMGLGQTFAILIGGIDLSVAAVAALASIVAAMLVPSLGFGAFFVAVLVGSAAGAITGVVHARARIPSFIASLGAMGVWTGVGFYTSNATPIQILQKDAYVTQWATGVTFGIPNEIIIGFIVLAICFFIQRYTRFGRSVMAIGAGELAAKLSGVRIERYKTLVFVLSGTLAGFSGAVLAARMSGGSARIADGFLLKTVAIVILGGTSISGGVGGVLRTVVGAFLIAALDTGMNIIGVDVYAQQMVYGAVVILAVALTIDRSKMPIVK